MKNIIIKIVYGLTALFLCLAGMFSCSDKDDHYRVEEEVSERISLWELISRQPELSRFAEMLKIVSYDRLLEGDQAYTVWAPENKFLDGVDMSDSTAVLHTVTTHIARYAHSASGTVAEYPGIAMLNAKKLFFVRSGDTYFMDGVELQTKNLVAKNGILHTLNGQIRFFPNVWQQMDLPGYDSIRTYFHSFDKREFLLYRSKQIDINEQGMVVYDSVFIDSNTMWYTYIGAKGVGYLNEEDSLYTMILPDNAAWREAYNRYYPHLLPDPVLDNPDSVQRANTQYSLVQDLVFRGAITSPGAYGVKDSLISTREMIIHDPAHLFEGSTPVRVSNGWVYPTSRLQYALWESCIKPVKVEAEMPYGRWHNESRDRGYIYSYYAMDNPAISNSRYLKVTGTGANDKPIVAFELPGVVAAEYDIYCVLLAPSFVDANSNDTTVTRVSFQVQQWDRINKKEEDRAWKTLASFGLNSTSGQFVSQKTGISKILAAEKFRFPFANVNETDNVFRLRVISSPSNAEINSRKFINVMRIDYLLLEPSR